MDRNERNEVSYYNQGVIAGNNWVFGTSLPVPPKHLLQIFDATDKECLSLWLSGLHDGIQRRFSVGQPILNDQEDVSNEFKSITYKLARIVRGTDCLYPSDKGLQLGQLLVKLRILDGATYDREVIAPINKSA